MKAFKLLFCAFTSNYQNLGNWRLIGSSDPEYISPHVSCELKITAPKKINDCLDINWNKSVKYNILTLSHVSIGKLNNIICDEISCHSYCRFHIYESYITMFSLAGIGIPQIFQMPQNKTLKCRSRYISWEVENEVLKLRLGNNTYIFTKISNADREHVIPLETFVIMQLLAHAIDAIVKNYY